jgi:hypothetical protein
MALAVAIAVLAFFAAFTAFMISETDTEELEWTRLAWIFSSVEAIAFGAAGALFGASVQRERAEKAEAQAENASEDAASGRALAAALKAEAPAGEGETYTTRGLGDGGDSASTAERHANLARQLFPD